MAFTKQAPFTKKVTDLPDKPSPTYTATDIKAHFQTPSDELMVTVNNAIDKLNATTDGVSGADNVGATGFDGLASNVQVLLDYLKANKTDLTGNHQGTWQGYTPTQTDPGIQSVVDDHTSQLADNANDINSRSINVLYPPAPLVAAKGDKVTDDTTAIQNLLNHLRDLGGGKAYFPNAKYLISATLKLPSKVYMIGLSSFTFKGIDKTDNQENFINNLNSVIYLKSGSNCNMIEPEDPENFFSSGISDIALYGNKINQTTTGLKGINVPTPAVTTNQRSQAIFRNVLIYEVKGTGFYGGKEQHELFFDNVCSYGCESHGFELYGQDIKGEKVLSGANGGNGFVIAHGGSLRGLDWDAWGNTYGMEIYDVIGINIVQLVVNRNKKNGILIRKDTYAPGNITFVRLGMGQNSQESSGLYSDILLQTDASGVYNLNISASNFTGLGSKYAIEDNSASKKNVSVVGSSFETVNFASGITNSIDTVSFMGCTDKTTGTALIEYLQGHRIRGARPSTPKEGDTRFNSISKRLETYGGGKWVDSYTEGFKYSSANVTVNEADSFILVSASGGARTVTLPPLANLTDGRKYTIMKNDSSANAVSVVASGTDTITNPTGKTITNQHGILEVYHAGTAWLVVN
jgi:hypothetical protein